MLLNAVNPASRFDMKDFLRIRFIAAAAAFPGTSEQRFVHR